MPVFIPGMYIPCLILDKFQSCTEDQDRAIIKVFKRTQYYQDQVGFNSFVKEYPIRRPGWYVQKWIPYPTMCLFSLVTFLKFSILIVIFRNLKTLNVLQWPTEGMRRRPWKWTNKQLACTAQSPFEGENSFLWYVPICLNGSGDKLISLSGVFLVVTFPKFVSHLPSSRWDNP
jgi:hypothetical protein